MLRPKYKQNVFSPVVQKRAEIIVKKKKKIQTEDKKLRTLGGQKATINKKSRPIIKRILGPPTTPIPVPDAKWKCCVASGAAVLGVDLKHYYGSEMTKEMRQELKDLKVQLNYEGPKCPPTQEAGPHAGNSCGLRLLYYLRRKRKGGNE